MISMSRRNMQRNRMSSTGNPSPQDPRSVLGSAAVAGVAAGAKAGAAALATGSNLQAAGVQAVKTAIETAGVVAGATVAQTARDILAANANTTSASGGATTAGVTIEAPSSSQRNTTGRLDYATTPVETSLDTGLKPNIYSSIYEEILRSDDDQPVYTPMGITQGIVRFPSSGSDLYNFIDNVVQVVFYNAVQRAVSFSVDPNLVSTANLVGSTNASMYALQIYYFFDSILSYTNNPLNRNAAMDFARNSLTAEDLFNLSNLRYIISGLPIPPNARLLCRWLSQTYKNSDMPHSSIIKISPVEMVVNEPGFYKFSTSEIVNALGMLKAYRSTYSLLSRACPKWIQTELPNSNAAPLHDKGFMSFFSNTPCIYEDDQDELYCVPGNLSSYYFSTFDENLDGIIPALGAFWTGGKPSDNDLYFTPSLFKPFSNDYTSADLQASYNVNQWFFGDDQFGFIPTRAFIETASQLGFTYHADGSIVTPPGAEPILNYTENSTYQTALQATEWLFSIDTIGLVEGRKAYGSGNPRSGKRNNNRR